MKVGFIGLGTLGKTIARRMQSEGVELVVWNRTREKCEEMRVPIAESPADLISKTDLIFLNLTDSTAVCSIINGETGLAAGASPGKIVVDTTTNHFGWVGSFYDTLDAVGANYLEAPVLGSVVPASKGLLTVLISGDETSYNKARSLIETFGKNLFYLKERALASKMKIINNLTLGTFMAVLAEAVSLGESAGMEKDMILDILSRGGGDSMVLNAKRDKLSREDFSNHFSSAMIYKDLHYLQDLARELHRPLLTATVVKEIFGMTFSKGWENDDFSGVYRIFSEL
nr:NAD(P)-dependent oxidoreductase [candidate division Zixibacteria bacterium]